MPFDHYRPPLMLRSGHAQTIFPSLLRRVRQVIYRRERIYTPDGDFLDLDWASAGRRRLVIVSHGLEGNSQRAYVRGMVRALNQSGWDALAWNYRSCSGEPNRRPRFYHNGATDDLQLVLDHAVGTRRYDSMALVGFSLGGNLTLIYLGQKGAQVHPCIKAAVVFSVPCDLASSARQLARPANAFYMRRFLRLLRGKVQDKARRWPDLVSIQGYDRIKTFRDFDDRYTAPLHGFLSAGDYWRRCSSVRYIAAIRVPTLLVNACNDPFLTPGCFPTGEADRNPLVTFEMPLQGGHVGFVELRQDGHYWSERRAVYFLNKTDHAR